MVGLTADNAVNAIEILDQNETPGLGAKIDSDEFKGGFAGRGIADTKWLVTRDKGDIEGITAATISSRAVIQAVKQGLDAYREHEATIRSARQKTKP